MYFINFPYCYYTDFVVQSEVQEPFKHNVGFQDLDLLYWAVHAGLLTPLTFAWYHLSPLAAFTSGVYFLHNGRQ